MPQAQGIDKQFAYKKQAAKGTEETGSGGQLLRRETATLNTQKDTFNSNEINSHQQYTGDTYGVKRQSGQISGLLSAGTYAELLGSILKEDFAAVANITTLSLTIAANGTNWDITRGSGSWLTDDVFVGDIKRLSGGSLDAANVGKNLLVLAVTATVLTVRVVNGTALTAEGPIASCTLETPGQQSSAAIASHTDDYYTFEEWYSDISISRRKFDVKPLRADLGLPAQGNATISIPLGGLGDSDGTSQSLTSPAAETTSEILNSVNGVLVVNGTPIAIATGLNLTIDAQVTFGEPTIASKTIGDMAKGDLRVSGSFTALFEDDSLYDLFQAETVISLVFVVTDNADANAEFVSFVLPAIKLLTSDNDDGKKQLVQSFNFTAQYNGAGGTGTANRDSIVAIQDSLAA